MISLSRRLIFIAGTKIVFLSRRINERDQDDIIILLDQGATSFFESGAIGGGGEALEMNEYSSPGQTMCFSLGELISESDWSVDLHQS